MIGVNTKFDSNKAAVENAVRRAKYRSFANAAASIRKDAASTIEQAPRGVPSAPGTPPHTHKRKFLARSFRYDADEFGAVVGPLHSVVGEAGAIQEFGEENHPERPFMRPALERNIDRFRREWAGSVHE